VAGFHEKDGSSGGGENKSKRQQGAGREPDSVQVTSKGGQTPIGNIPRHQGTVPTGSNIVVTFTVQYEKRVVEWRQWPADNRGKNLTRIPGADPNVGGSQKKIVGVLI